MGVAWDLVQLLERSVYTTYEVWMHVCNVLFCLVLAPLLALYNFEMASRDFLLGFFSREIGEAYARA